MEHLLHYVWKYKLYSLSGLVTTKGLPVSVIDPGIQNTDAGPDFFNAKIKIGETMWAGNVEIHSKASDWFLHRHHKDKAYDSVILHLAGTVDTDVCRTNGEAIPQVQLTIPLAVRKNIDWLIHRDIPIPCLYSIRDIERIHISSWMSALLCERLERKTKDILLLMEQYNNDWNEVFYIILTRCFGFGLNNDAFEQLAKSLPLHAVYKQRSSCLQIEAMLFGQAGMLEEDETCCYYRQLQQEYKFLQHKYGLKPLTDGAVFKSLRVRPVNFPHIKIAQLAAVWHHCDTLFSAILNEDDMQQIKNLFSIPASAYWDTHYHFKHASPAKKKAPGNGALTIILINAVAPMLFAYGQKNRQDAYCERALRFLETIPPEKNHITAIYCRAGIQVCNAGDSQALIQLKKEYCDRKKCLHCRIGFRLLKRVNP
ncbi:MAG: DUF2851 family protein [Tannerellaceae bacterium]|jgi:hypothetical protein|nr:DUF2851 family protein [Tannerellaceae bacterium]